MSYKDFGVTGNFRFDATVTSMSQPLTVVVWIKMSATEWNNSANYSMIYAQDMDSIDQQVRLYSSHDLVAFVARTSTNNQTSSIDFNGADPGGYDDIWVPTFARYVSNVSRYAYIEDSSNKGSHSTNDRNVTGLIEFRIGKYANPGSGPFKGKIAEVSLWDAALDESEIDLFCPTSKAGAGPRATDIPTATSGANCVGYWPLDYDSDTQTDESGTSNGSLVATGTRVYDSDHPAITAAGEFLLPLYNKPQRQFLRR